jgi:spore maturation protein SpmA
VDATEMFLKNVEEMERITKLYEEAADTMAMFIQAQRLNTFCVEFTQVRIPNTHSIHSFLSFNFLVTFCSRCLAHCPYDRFF